MRDYLANLKAALPAMNDTVWVGSINPDGTPHLSTRAVLGSDDGRIFFSTPADTGLAQNLRHRNTGTVCAANPAAGRGAQLKGTFTLLSSGTAFDQYSNVARRLGLPAPGYIVAFKPFLEFLVAPSAAAGAPLN